MEKQEDIKENMGTEVLEMTEIIGIGVDKTERMNKRWENSTGSFFFLLQVKKPLTLTLTLPPLSGRKRAKRRSWEESK